MKILITGASGGIGRAIAKKFLSAGHEVIGLDILPAPFSEKNYTHHVCDVSFPILKMWKSSSTTRACRTAGRTLK